MNSIISRRFVVLSILTAFSVLLCMPSFAGTQLWDFDKMLMAGKLPTATGKSMTVFTNLVGADKPNILSLGKKIGMTTPLKQKFGLMSTIGQDL